MSDALPPLTALRAFEAAARHLSFAKAADELNVTPAALSFQIKSLEDHLGHPLFHRLNRAVALTELGEAFAPGLSDGFAAIRHAWRGAKRQLNDTHLTVTAGPAFTSKWLAPRLFRFAEAHPETELRFVASLKVFDFERDEIDLAIRFGESEHAGLHNETLFHDIMAPLMTPALAETYGSLEGMKHAPLLHDDSIDFLTPRFGWPKWMQAVGVDRQALNGPRFSQADHAIDAALAGGGVVLARTVFAAGALRDGTLVAPFKTAIMSSGKFRIVHQKGAETRPQMSIFLDWIRREAEDMAAIFDSFEIVTPP